MAYGTNESLQLPGLVANSTGLALSQFYVMKHSSTAGEVIAVNATTDVAIGILQNNPGAGEAAEILILGVSKAKAGGTITKGAAVGYDSTARVVKRTGDNSHIIGYANATASSGDIVSITVVGHQRR